MSIESATAFMDRMKTDEEFAARMGEARSKEDRWVILKESGFCFTEDEFSVVFDPDETVTGQAAQHSTLEQCQPESCCS